MQETSNEEVEFDAVDGTMTTVSTRRKSDANRLTLKRAIADVTDKPVTRIVPSHEHDDHVGGTGVFPETQVICHAACQAVFDLDVVGMAPENVDVTFTDSLQVDFRGPPVNGEIRKAMEAGGPMQVMTSMATWPRDLKLPQYAD